MSDYQTSDTFTLCHECACEVVNSDASGRDFQDVTDDENASRDAGIEAMGQVVLVATESIGYFTCFVCSQVDYGDADIFATPNSVPTQDHSSQD